MATSRERPRISTLSARSPLTAVGWWPAALPDGKCCGATHEHALRGTAIYRLAFEALLDDLIGISPRHLPRAAVLVLAIATQVASRAATIPRQRYARITCRNGNGIHDKHGIAGKLMNNPKPAAPDPHSARKSSRHRVLDLTGIARFSRVPVSHARRRPGGGNT